MIPLARRLKHRVRIEQRNAVRDGAGGTTYEWVLLDEVWAEVGASSGGRVKQTAQGGNENIAALPIRIRYRDGITDQMRIAYKGTSFSIAHIENERQADRTLLLDCREVPVGSI